MACQRKRRIWHPNLDNLVNLTPILNGGSISPLAIGGLTGRSYLIAKRVLDLLFVLIASPCLFFLLAFCALLIKLESPSGPIFFMQQRTGKDGRRFAMYKFRTMVPDAEALKQTYAELNELAWPRFQNHE